jgi:hypothetical protein
VNWTYQEDEIRVATADFQSLTACMMVRDQVVGMLKTYNVDIVKKVTLNWDLPAPTIQLTF